MAGSQNKTSIEEKKPSDTAVNGVVKDEEVFSLAKVTKTWPGVQGFTLDVPELIVRRG